VAGPVEPEVNRLTDRFCSEPTAREIGSLRASAPSRIVIDLLPPKVTAWLEPGTRLAPLFCRPT
jgi:hypothetical protein